MVNSLYYIGFEIPSSLLVAFFVLVSLLDILFSPEDGDYKFL
jgi:hypothetical protein